MSDTGSGLSLGTAKSSAGARESESARRRIEKVGVCRRVGHGRRHRLVLLPRPQRQPAQLLRLRGGRRPGLRRPRAPQDRDVRECRARSPWVMIVPEYGLEIIPPTPRSLFSFSLSLLLCPSTHQNGERPRVERDRVEVSPRPAVLDPPPPDIYVAPLSHSPPLTHSLSVSLSVCLSVTPSVSLCFFSLSLSLSLALSLFLCLCLCLCFFPPPSPRPTL